MINLWLPDWTWCLTILIPILLTFGGILGFQRFLPKDQGREFAVNGALSQGKPRGAGIILIIAFTLSCVLCMPLPAEYIIYLAAIFVEMMSGYLDDASDKPWGELKKGIIDLLVALTVSVTIYWFHNVDGKMPVALLDAADPFYMPGLLYIALGVILIWASINVTNCSDGVDGLCTSLSIVTLTGALFFLLHAGQPGMFSMTTIMILVLLVYLWFNCSPSRLLMGDAGSRALGLFLALAFMFTGTPFLFIPMALLLIIDGGLGLLKLTVIRVCKAKNFMKNIRTPIHDHARKNKGWGDTQVVTRFTLLQILLVLLTIIVAASVWETVWFLETPQF